MEVMLRQLASLLDLPDRYASITAADVQRVARKTFAPHRRNVVTLVPARWRRDRARRRAAAAADRETSLGLTLLAIQKRGLPLFHLRLSLPAGACEDPRGKAGLAQFTVDLLRRGTRRRPAHDVDEMIESMGAQLYADVSTEEPRSRSPFPRAVRARARRAVGGRAGACVRGERGGRRARRTIAGLQSDLDEPSAVAGRAVVSLGYGPGHPYAHPSQGFRRDVETFQREDALSFHATRYQQQGGLLAVVGQGNPRDLLDQLQRKLAQWESSWPGRSQRSALQFAALAPSQEMRAVVIHKPDATQAQVRIVSPGLSRATPRYAEAVVANTALGAGSPRCWWTPSASIAAFPTRCPRGCT